MVAQNAQERLLHLADVLEGWRRVFQQKIGKSCSYIVNVTTPSRKALRDIKAAYPQVNTDWIITGEGEMFIEGATLLLIIRGEKPRTIMKVQQSMLVTT